jgi:WD40 repeat protein
MLFATRNITKQAGYPGFRAAATAIFLAGFFLTAPPSFAGSLRRTWDVNLAEKIVEPKGIGATLDHPVSAIRFSPDGTKIAVAIDAHDARDLPPWGVSHVLIVDTSQPDSAPRQFTVPTSSTPERPLRLEWSSSGDLLLAGPALIRVSTGAQCELPDGTNRMLVGDDEVISANKQSKEPDVLAPPLFFGYAIYGLDCGFRADLKEWKNWALADYSPERGVLMLQQDGDTLLVDWKTRQTVHRWSHPAAGETSWRFANNGQLECSEGRAEGLQCWDTDTGAQTAKSRTAHCADTLATAIAQPIFVCSHRQALQDANLTAGAGSQHDTTNGAASGGAGNDAAVSFLMNNLVIETSNGRQVATWRRVTQTFGQGGEAGHKADFVLSLSADGQYLAEGGDGKLTLYKVMR